MALALDASQHVRDVVQAPDQAGPQVESFRAESGPRRPRPCGGLQSRPKQVVHDNLERLPAFAGDLLQPSGNVCIQGECRAHIMMLIS